MSTLGESYQMAQRPPERDELDTLLDPLLRFAQEMLQKHGEFFPIGNVMALDGSVSMIGTDVGADRPPSAEVIDALVAGMRAKAAAGEIRAVGICYDVRIRDADGKATDAIAVGLEHRGGDAATVFMPYSKGRFSGLKFGQLSGAPGERRVFVSG
jgi:hypothetical protein